MCYFQELISKICEKTNVLFYAFLMDLIKSVM